MHVEGVRRLAQACRFAGVRRLVHLSALGAGRDDVTRFQRTKGEGEDVLGALEGLEVSIVRPSLAIGPGGATGDFFSALAALPFPPRLGPGTWRVQPLHVAELAGLVAKLALAAQAPKSVDAVGPAPMNDRRVGARIARLARPDAGALPAAAAICSRRLGVAQRDRRGGAGGPRARRTARARQCRRPRWGSPRRWGGRRARSRRAWRSSPATLALNSFGARASISFSRPCAYRSRFCGSERGSFRSGLFRPPNPYVMLAEVGVHGPLAEVALFGGAAVNLVLGGLLLVDWRPARIGLAMLALLGVYTVVGLLLPPEIGRIPRAYPEEFADRRRLARDVAMERPNGAAKRRRSKGADEGPTARRDRARVVGGATRGAGLVRHEFDLAFDLHGNVERQFGHADRRAGVGADVGTEDVGSEIRKAVNDARRDC